MTLEEFERSISESAPPAELKGALLGLWREAKGDWDGAHACAQDDLTRAGSWVHAYLHRKDGDHGNAGYWYSRAGKPVPAISSEKEWRAIAGELLSVSAEKRA